MRSLTARGCLLASLGAAIFTFGAAFAHERRGIGEDYEFLIGFMEEPAYAGWKNAVSLRVTEASTDEPVTGLEDTLILTITYLPSGTSKTLSLRTLYDDPGHYAADIVPAASGHYSFRISGGIGGGEMDETFGSRMDGGGFHVESSDQLSFP